MAQVGVIRPLKGGGCSICRAAEENVGKRRCQHVMSNAKMIVVERNHGMNTINIEGIVDGKDSGFSVAASTSEIKSYISNLSTSLSNKERATILAVLQND